jgi:hypothetical protein
VLSNADLALSMTGQGDPSQLNGTPWQGMPTQTASPGAHIMGAPTPGGGFINQGDGATIAGSPTPGGGFVSPSTSAGADSGSSNPYSENGMPQGTSDRISAMLGQSTQQPQTQQQSQVQGQPDSAGALPSIQKFRRFAPTEQQMGLGYLEENGGPTEQDAQYLMSRQAPNFKLSQTARYAGI